MQRRGRRCELQIRCARVGRAANASVPRVREQVTGPGDTSVTRSWPCAIMLRWGISRCPGRGSASFLMLQDGRAACAPRDGAHIGRTHAGTRAGASAQTPASRDSLTRDGRRPEPTPPRRRFSARGTPPQGCAGCASGPVPCLERNRTIKLQLLRVAQACVGLRSDPVSPPRTAAACSARRAQKNSVAARTALPPGARARARTHTHKHTAGPRPDSHRGAVEAHHPRPVGGQLIHAAGS